MVVEEYIAGNGSLPELMAKYNICAVSSLARWISVYNSDMELKDYNPKQEVYMAEARRKVTIEERKEIVAYCIEHGCDYKNTAEQYDVSYSQVYSWVRKYNASGEEGLADKRGHHKSDEEVDELEKLRRENKRLKRQLEERDMIVELLKKVKEFERRRF
ncbi:transposase IS3/IS911 family protein [Lachnoclostridium phytofermentans ISDg]|nr:transposase IS3/IS911 family protein [Lachnoclostridium phytofermentans ISDg]